jgi:hypothetical protein
MITSIFAAHPWLRDENQAVPLDILIYKLVRSYVRATPFKRAALKVVSQYLIIKTQLFMEEGLFLSPPWKKRKEKRNIKEPTMLKNKSTRWPKIWCKGGAGL